MVHRDESTTRRRVVVEEVNRAVRGIKQPSGRIAHFETPVPLDVGTIIRQWLCRELHGP